MARTGTNAATDSAAEPADFLGKEPEEEYHAKSEQYLTSHQLSDFRKNPLLFHKKELGLVAEDDRPAYVVGRAAHKLILEGRDAFEKEYAVGGPVNPRTGRPFGSRTKKFAQWAEKQGKPVISDDQYALISSMNESVRSHEYARELIEDGIAEGVIRKEYLGVPSQARPDWFSFEHGLLDLKTCQNIDWFEMDARSYGYAHQMAFYRALFSLVTGITASVWLIAVEKEEPFRCGVWRVGDDVLGMAQKENEEAIARLMRCRETDTWPTGYEEVRTLDHL